MMPVLTAGVALALNEINCASLSQDPLTPECNGTPQNDAIEGRNAEDIIYAGGGDDQVDANDKNDEAYGGAGRDRIQGGGYDDKLYGGDGRDILKDQNPFQGKDSDELRGGGGNDVLDGYDSNAGETLVCGPGDNDTAYFDRLTNGLRDTVSPSCENKVVNDHPN
jgi:Ca2+-binding RTX toxin-like protein